MAVNANALLLDLEQENEILAYVDDSYTSAQAKALQKELEAIPNVASATYISKEQATEDFAADYPDEELFQDLDPEIFQDRYAIKVVDLAQQSQTLKRVEEVTGITDVNAHEEIAGGFLTVRNVATVVCVALIAILFIVSVFIISNTIKLTTFDRRDEIAIMKMVGATNAFIRLPFVVEGFIIGIIAAAVGFFLEWGLYDFVLSKIAQLDTLKLFVLTPFTDVIEIVAAAYAVTGFLVGVFGSLLSIRKFLKV